MLRLLMLAVVSVPDGSDGPSASVYRHIQAPSVELWTNREHGAVLHRGDRMRVFFRAADDSYVTVFQVDTDGRVRVLFPDAPWEDNFARGRRAYEVDQRYGNHAFVIDDYPGEGYIFAVATLDPFDYRQMVRADHWDYRVIASGGRISGDPYAAMQNLVDLIVPSNYDSYSYDVYSYYVERRYDYPRFLCYDCHTYTAYPYWDPYRNTCIRFRIVIYDAPYYYPARAYPGTRVVYRPSAAQIEPRFVFKDRTPTEPYVVRTRERQTEPAARRPADPGVTSGAVGGSGAVPTPARVPQTPTPREPVTVPTARPGVQRVPQAPPERTTVVRPSEGRERAPTVQAPAREPARPEVIETPAERQPSGGRAATPPPTRSVPQANPRPRLEPRETPPARPPAAAQPERRPPTTQREPQKPKSEPARQPSTPPRKPPERPPSH